ncbi:Tim44/TimA family putative adaptor protein [Croceicoccus naphthovorans]|uniref:Preprotein translocase subunit Tim44 n=1 Tax=Croceicoccus naphthovorans TaxID=1348774 RepID=A0A0G3XEM8_9SPHN|nr:Tim44/TimA family putative adaptor protein [Croceicoccus naphthovorans]AKM09034.1 preprotein translocase subunit Tim44 [Croceicoccus naphthovorans]MBB3991472.1 putative lipid-binding transport protein (Tim44 family) [Croceicoccus naphthovorans]
MIVEIVILAMIAAFLGLRLYSVLGRRAEHEEETLMGHLPRAAEPRQPAQGGVESGPARTNDPAGAAMDRALADVPMGAHRALREIAASDRRFTPAAFTEGAKAAYGMILEAFWKGDKETLNELCDDDVYASFASAIDAREEAGEVVENRLIRINQAEIASADFDSPMARITVRFDADIAAMTKDKDGNMIAGSLDDAVEIHDVWTFSRKVTAMRPDWLLDETDEG